MLTVITVMNGAIKCALEIYGMLHCWV